MWSALFGGGGASTSRRNAATHGQGGAAPRHEHGRGRHGGPNTPRTLSLGELERLHEQVVRTQSITPANREAVVEVLRAIAEVMIWGDQNEPDVFDFFLEAQTLSHCVRLLGASTTPHASVAVQLLQSMSIMIQNIRRDTSVYYLFSNNHINRLIAYDFDFAGENEELLAFYISFLKTVSLRLNVGTVQFFYQGHASPPQFPLYTLATRFVDHPESMVRIAVRTVTLNVYAVPDEGTRQFVVHDAKNYFPAVTGALLRRCLAHDAPGSGAGAIETANAEACDIVSYISDVLALDAPQLREAVLSHFDRGLIEPLLLGSLLVGADAASAGGAAAGGAPPANGDVLLQRGTALHLLGRVVEIVTHGPLVNGLVCRLLAPDGQCEQTDVDAQVKAAVERGSGASAAVPTPEGGEGAEGGGEGAPATAESGGQPMADGEQQQQQHVGGGNELRATLLGVLRSSDGRSALAALQCLASIVRSDAVNGSILRRVGLLPQSSLRKQALLDALVKDDEAMGNGASGSGSGGGDGGAQSAPQASPQQLEIIEALLTRLHADLRKADRALAERRRQLACWLLVQLAPPPGDGGATASVRAAATEMESSSLDRLAAFAGGVWCDMVPLLLDDEWGRTRRVAVAPRPPRAAMEFVGAAVAPPTSSHSRSGSNSGSSSVRSAHELFTACGAFVAARIACLALAGMTVPAKLEAECGDASAREAAAAFEALGSAMDDLSGVHACVGGVPAIEGAEVQLDGADALPCRVAFERGREHAVFLVLTTHRSVSTSVSDSHSSAASGRGGGNPPLSGTGCGALLLVERSVDAQHLGVVRAVAHLAGARAERDEAHPCWLHVRVRSPLPQRPSEVSALMSSKRAERLVTDGRWTLAFRDEHACGAAMAFAAFATAQLRETSRAAIRARVGGGVDKDGAESMAVSEGAAGACADSGSTEEAQLT